MLNFRKLKQDFSSNIIKEGRELYDQQKVVSAKLLHLDAKTMRVSAKVLGQFDNCYESEIEIDRQECETIDSDCDCPYNYDCHHLAAVLFYLEVHIDKILVAFSKENDLKQIGEKSGIDKEERKKLLEKIKEAESKEVQRQEEQYQKQLLQEYIVSSQILAASPFFRPQEKQEVDRAEFALIFNPNQESESKGIVEIQLALRLPFRSKPLYVPQIKPFLDALRYEESVFIGGKKYSFSLKSFDVAQQEIVRMVRDGARFYENANSERALRVAQLDLETFGMILAKSYDLVSAQFGKNNFITQEEELPSLPGLYEGTMETPLKFSPIPSHLRFSLEYIPPPTSKILVNPHILIGEDAITLEDARFFECAKPGMLYKNAYYRFPDNITRVHLRNLRQIRDMTVPEPLFGTFVENALPQLARYAEVSHQEAIEDFVTLPFVGNVEAVCDISYLDGELDAGLHFIYDGHKIPSAASKLGYDDVSSFVTSQGILARNLVEERQIIDDLFQDFLFNPETCVYVSKSEKKIVEFMTDVIPRNQHRVTFNCPQNLLDQFIYDQTKFSLKLSHTARIDVYEIELSVDGALRGVRLDQLWECMGAKRSFIELDSPKSKGKKGTEGNKMPKILVLDLERLNGVIQLFDEMGILVMENHTMERPLWSLANIDASQFEGLPVEFSMTDKLIEIREQMLGEKLLTFSEVPADVKATLRGYQQEGVRWLERLRMMFLNGILADDMGLGKTLQAIVALTQHMKKKSGNALIVCPTSLLYNWKEEFAKFNPKLKVTVVDGIPSNRKKLIEQMENYHVLITSYTLLQKDIEHYKLTQFSYVILDEAQHIKNRGTRNAKSVKMVQAEHRLILSGTPIENSLDELWSLFDFLMPSFLGTYDRFLEKYIRVSGKEQSKNLEYLRKKVSPFILRRMKADHGVPTTLSILKLRRQTPSGNAISSDRPWEPHCGLTVRSPIIANQPGAYDRSCEHTQRSLRMRCGVYTRFSSDHQHPASLDDQQLVCQRYADHQGWRILTEHIYSDAALSGMGVQHRPAYQRLLVALASTPPPFEVLLVDDLSRLSRDAAEILRLVRVLQEMGLKLISVADGIETGTKLSKLALSVKAIINEVYLDDLRDRTLRGLQGRFARGLHTGGRIYGYRSVPVPDPAGRADAAGHPLTLGAHLTVDPDEAHIVRQIFAWFIQGLGLRTIADRLNTQTIPFPAQSTQRGGKRKGWASSAVRVILKNEKYRGRWVWGRRLFFKDPLTGRRRARLRPSTDWQVAEHADLRIVSEDLWARVETRFQKLESIYAPRHAHGHLNGRQRGSPSRRAALFSGLLTCQVCGAGLVVVSGNLQKQNGRYGCGFHRNKGPQICGNGLTVKVATVERCLVNVIQAQILSPAALAYLVQSVNTRLQALSTEQDGTHQRIEGELQQVEDELHHIERAILAGLVGETTAGLLKDREVRRTALRQQLQRVQHPRVRTHPVTLSTIRTRLEDLYGLLSGDSVQVNAFFREHLTSIVCSPMEDGDQRFYRACGAVNGTALMVTLGLVKECDFGGCGGRI